MIAALAMILKAGNEGIFVCGFILLVPVIIFIILMMARGQVTEEQKKALEERMMKEAEKNAPTASLKAKAVIRQEIGDREIIAELPGMAESYIAVTDNTVFLASVFMGIKNVKRYPVGAISTVSVRGGGLSSSLEVLMPGAVEGRGSNDNRIMFQSTVTPYAKVQQLANIVMELRDKHRSNKTQKTEKPQSVPELIKQLASLRDSGVLTNEEFEEKKKELLKKM
jgi:hypothetical protein